MRVPRSSGRRLACLLVCLFAADTRAADPPAVAAWYLGADKGASSRPVGVVLWSAKSGQEVQWYRAGEVRVGKEEQGTPPHDEERGESKGQWKVAADHLKSPDPTINSLASRIRTAVGDAATVEATKAALEKEFSSFQFAEKANWMVAETSDGLAAFLDNPGLIDKKHVGKVYTFDSLTQMKRLLDPKSLKYENKLPDNPVVVRFTSAVEPALAKLPQAPESAARAVLLKSSSDRRASERLLVRWNPIPNPPSGGPFHSRRVLWLPTDDSKERNIRALCDAFGAPMGQLPNPIESRDYEAIRATALFPASEHDGKKNGQWEELSGQDFKGFQRDESGRVALKSALEWETGADAGTRAWKVTNSFQQKLAPRVSEKSAPGNIDCVFGPTEFLFGTKLASAFGQLTPDDKEAPKQVRTNQGPEYYPAILVAPTKPTAPAESVTNSNPVPVWRFVARDGAQPFYLMDRELTARHLVGAMLRSDPRQVAWWRTNEGRKKGIEAHIASWEKPPENMPGASDPKAPAPAPFDGRGPWEGVRVLANRLAATFGKHDGEWEEFLAALRFDALLADRDDGDPKSHRETVTRRWIRQREVWALAAVFEQRAFAWAEFGWSINAPVAQLDGKALDVPQEVGGVFPDGAEDRAKWNEFAEYCWKQFGPKFPGGTRPFLIALKRYHATRQVLKNAGTAFPSAAVNPLDDPLTGVSANAVAKWFPPAKPDGDEGGKDGKPKDGGAPAGALELRLPTAEEWKAAAKDVWPSDEDAKTAGWTGDRARTWPLDALPKVVRDADRSRDGIYSLVGGVSELVALGERKFGVMGANYRTELAADDPHFAGAVVVPINPAAASEVVGIRLALAPKGNAIGKGQPKVGVYGPKPGSWDAGKELPTAFETLFGERAVEGAQPGDEFQFRWNYDRRAVIELIGDHPEWWSVPLRSAVYGFRDGKLRDQLPVSKFLKKLDRETKDGK